MILKTFILPISRTLPFPNAVSPHKVAIPHQVANLPKFGMPHSSRPHTPSSSSSSREGIGDSFMRHSGANSRDSDANSHASTPLSWLVHVSLEGPEDELNSVVGAVESHSLPFDVSEDGGSSVGNFEPMEEADPAVIEAHETGSIANFQNLSEEERNRMMTRLEGEFLSLSYPEQRALFPDGVAGDWLHQQFLEFHPEAQAFLFDTAGGNFGTDHAQMMHELDNLSDSSDDEDGQWIINKVAALHSTTPEAETFNLEAEALLPLKNFWKFMVKPPKQKPLEMVTDQTCLENPGFHPTRDLKNFLSMRIPLQAATYDSLLNMYGCANQVKIIEMLRKVDSNLEPYKMN